ncbi:MAG: minichromosome maintenance protein MCM, partial [Candidatus Woesearchaeota archaeon]|nr:minichromosome maintenance protein MCM [Candidatus Woesearchaeota archaeon]
MPLEPTEIIKRFQDFLEKNYQVEIAEKARKKERFLVVDFNLLSSFDPILSEELLETPEEVLKAGELALEKYDAENFHIRIKNLPDSLQIMIKDVRSKHINKLLFTKGLVRQKSDVRPQVTSARFECPSCGNVITVLQLDQKFKEPSRCGCGRKGKFRLVSKELVDAQKIVLEEAPEDLDGGEQPKRIDLFLKTDLVSPLSDKKTNPGTKIIVNGILKEVSIPAKDGGKLVRFDLMIEVNYLEQIQEDFMELNISEEEENEIKALAADPEIYEKLVRSLAPTIYGHEKIKEALILQSFGGVRKKKKKGSATRGDIHVLLIGDPGAGKSQMLKRVSEIAPKARYVSGKGASGAGLTATVVKDEFIKGYALEAGALVLANRGICCIDELDKMGKEDRSAMHEALEQQTVTITKANIQATLRSETTVLAAANPKFGRFDPYEILAKQIDLPSTLINRFDLIFPIKDMPSEEKDEKLASFILGLHKDKIELKTDFENDMLRKYFAYARQKIKPVLSDEAVTEIKNYYVKMRASGSDDGGLKAIPITARQLEALIRLSEASAKVRLSNKVTKDDALRAIGLVHHCLSQIGMDPETGKFDIDRISSGVTASERNNIVMIKEMINELEVKSGKTISIEEVLVEASSKGISEDKVVETIEKLKRSGD